MPRWREVLIDTFATPRRMSSLTRSKRFSLHSSIVSLLQLPQLLSHLCQNCQIFQISRRWSQITSKLDLNLLVAAPVERHHGPRLRFPTHNARSSRSRHLASLCLPLQPSSIQRWQARHLRQLQQLPPSMWPTLTRSLANLSQRLHSRYRALICSHPIALLVLLAPPHTYLWHRRASVIVRSSSTMEQPSLARILQTIVTVFNTSTLHSRLPSKDSLSTLNVKVSAAS